LIAPIPKKIDGKPVDLSTIRNNENMVVKITNYRAKIEQIRRVQSRMHGGVGGGGAVSPTLQLPPCVTPPLHASRSGR
jgi:hypothetical protein